VTARDVLDGEELWHRWFSWLLKVASQDLPPRLDEGGPVSAADGAPIEHPAEAGRRANRREPQDGGDVPGATIRRSDDLVK
jgi:hypothetical protein